MPKKTKKRKIVPKRAPGPKPGSLATIRIDRISTKKMEPVDDPTLVEKRVVDTYRPSDFAPVFLENGTVITAAICARGRSNDRTMFKDSQGLKISEHGVVKGHPPSKAFRKRKPIGGVHTKA
jgi:hypothetical protein